MNNMKKSIEEELNTYEYGWNIVRARLFNLNEPQRIIKIETLYDKYTKMCFQSDNKLDKFCDGAIDFINEYDMTKILPEPKEFEEKYSDGYPSI